MSDCAVNDCSKEPFSRGLCRSHYLHQRRSGALSVRRHGEAKCEVSGCAGKHEAAGLCKTHYDERRRPKKRPPIPARMQFLITNANYKGEQCLEWPFRGRDKDGYGRCGQGPRAHRVMCTLAHGDPPFERAEAAHRCGNASCVNPTHIRWATHKENENDKYLHGTRRAKVAA